MLKIYINSILLRPARLLACLALASCSSQESSIVQVDSCGPVNDFDFICNMERPEDLKVIPGTRWIIASGFLDGSGLKLIDTETKTMQSWWSATDDQIGTHAESADLCGGPPAANFNAHGLSLRPLEESRYTLYVVNHENRESIEVLEVDASNDQPALSWVGCVPLPENLAANAVAAFPDGSLVATVLLHPGTTLADQVQGRVTGGVYYWQPGETSFELMPGTELPGNNGIETSPDGGEFYVVAFGLKTIFIYDREDTTTPVRQVEMPSFMPDNLQWTPVGDPNAQLLLAGMMYDEPACGGQRQVIDGVADGMRCSRGYMVGSLNPETLRVDIVDYGEPNPAFNGVSSAVLLDDNIWLGSYQSDRVAYRLLPALRNSAE